jgi:hypothetical protein
MMVPARKRALFTHARPCINPATRHLFPRAEPKARIAAVGCLPLKSFSMLFAVRRSRRLVPECNETHVPKVGFLASIRRTRNPRPARASASDIPHFLGRQSLAPASAVSLGQIRKRACGGLKAVELAVQLLAHGRREASRPSGCGTASFQRQQHA